MRPVKGVWCFGPNLYICGTKISLTAGEMRIFLALLSCPDMILSRDVLIHTRIHDPDKHGKRDLRSINTFITRIKAKIKDSTGYTIIITSCYGMGYQLNRYWYKAELEKRKAGQ